MKYHAMQAIGEEKELLESYIMNLWKQHKAIAVGADPSQNTAHESIIKTKGRKYLRSNPA